MSERDERKDSEKLTEKDRIGLRGGTGDLRVGLDSQHLKVDGHDERDDKLPHDRSWRTRREEEPDDPDRS